MNAKIDKSSPEPLYIQVQNWIKANIAAGEWGAKEKLPSESDLADALDVSRGTIKQAIKQLMNESILMQIHGKGTFVIGERLEYPLGERYISVAETMIENQKDFTTELLMLEQLPAEKQYQDIFRIGPEEQLYSMQRLRYYEGHPVVYMENFLPVRHFPRLTDHDLEEKTLFSIIEHEYKTTIEWGKRSFYAKAANEHSAEMLQVEVGTPLTFLEQTTYTVGDVPIEYSRVWIRSDQIRLTSILRRHA